MTVPPSPRPAFSGVRYIVLAGLCAAAAIAYIHRNLLPVPQERVARELGLSEDQMGTLFAWFFWAYAMGQLPCAWLGNRFGTRRMLPLFAALWSVAAAGLALCHRYEQLAVSQFANGLCQAGIFPCAVATIAVWFPKSERAMANGMLGAFMSVGAVIASASIGFLMRDPLIRLPTALGAEIPGLSWQSVFLALSTLGFVWAIVFFWWFRDRPDEHPAVGPEELMRIHGGELAPADNSTRPAGGPDAPRAVTPWGALLTSWPMLLICAQQFFRAAGYVFYGTWFPTYLRKTRDVSEEVSGYLTTLPLTGVVLGSLLGGLLADWIYRRTGSLALSRKGLSIGGLACCAVLMLVAYFIQDPLMAASVIALGAFCAGVANPLSYALSIDLAAGHVSVVFSLMNMSGNIGAALSPKFVNWVVDATSRSATEKNWAAALLLYVGIYVAGTLCWLAIDTRRPVVAR